ncbi:hypothetical protein ACFVZZ_14650 [Streptomyces chartreusis]|uniref:hypothetical protein n=1 Tax=Streptomyces chartreusis TaxID=1969 RepID=UPI0036DAE975
MTGQARVNRGTALGAGAVLLALGWLLVALALRAGYDAASAEYTGTPVCDGQVMTPGDSCIAFGNGAGETGTYEEIIAEKRRQAKAEAWGWAEAEGGLGAALVVAAAAGIGFGGRLQVRANAWVFTGVAFIPLLGVAGAVWGLQSRADAASPVHVGILGPHWPWPDTPYSAVLTLATTAFAALCYFSQLFGWGAETPTLQTGPAASGALTASPHLTPDQARQDAEDRRSERQERFKAADEAFDNGLTDDPWNANRLSLDADGRTPARHLARSARIIRALGASVFLIACALGAGHQLLGLDLPVAAAPALTLVVSWLVFAARGVPTFPAGAVAWAYGACALLSLATAAVTVVTLPAATWSGLMNAVAFMGGFLALTGWFGPSLPHPSIAGRILFTINGVAQLQFAAALAILIYRTPEPRGLSTFVTFLSVIAFLLGSGLSLRRAGKTESQGAVPAPLAATCLGASALTLAATACWVAFSDVGPLGWAIEVLYTIVSLTHAGGAYRRLSKAPQPESELNSTAEGADQRR